MFGKYQPCRRFFFFFFFLYRIICYGKTPVFTAWAHCTSLYWIKWHVLKSTVENPSTFSLYGRNKPYNRPRVVVNLQLVGVWRNRHFYINMMQEENSHRAGGKNRNGFSVTSNKTGKRRALTLIDNSLTFPKQWTLSDENRQNTGKIKIRVNILFKSTGKALNQTSYNACGTSTIAAN